MSMTVWPSSWSKDVQEGGVDYRMGLDHFFSSATLASDACESTFLLRGLTHSPIETDGANFSWSVRNSDRTSNGKAEHVRLSIDINIDIVFRVISVRTSRIIRR